jgi:hypothetical protein
VVVSVLIAALITAACRGTSRAMAPCGVACDA